MQGTDKRTFSLGGKVTYENPVVFFLIIFCLLLILTGDNLLLTSKYVSKG